MIFSMQKSFSAWRYLPGVQRAGISLMATAVFLLCTPASALAANYLYIVNNSTDSVGLLDLTSLSIAATVTVGDGPLGIAISGTGAYVANQTAGTLSVINISRNTIVATVTVGSSPTNVVVSGTGVYVANNGATTVSVIDKTNNQVERTITVGSGPRGMAVSGTGVFVTNVNSNNVSVIDTVTQSVEKTISVGAIPNAAAAAGTGVYITNADGGTVSVIDIANLAVEATISVGTAPSGAVVSGTGVYIMNYVSDSVTVIDRANNLAERTISVGDGPLYAATTGTGVYVSNSNANSISIIDTATQSVERTVTSTGNGQHGLAIATNIDFATESPTLTAPAASSTSASPLTVTFTLPETALAGSVTLNFNNNSNVNATVTLTDTSSASFTLDPADIDASAHVSSTTLNALPDGTYTVTLSYRDASGNSAATDDSSSVILVSTDSCAAGVGGDAVDSRHYGSYCYTRHTAVDKSYADAEVACADLGGTLAMPKTSVIQAVINSMQASYAWIGLSDRETENTFMWADRTLLGSFTYWNPGQPQGGTGENCVYMENAYLWHDYPCEDAHDYFCQIPDTVASTPSTNSGTGGGGAGGGRRSVTETVKNEAVQRSSSAAGSVSGPSSYFSDVPSSAWFYRFVEELRVKKIISGYKDAKGNETYRFGPANAVSYGELAKMIALLTGHTPANMTATQHWAEPYVREARRSGLSVYLNETLNLDTPATRGAVIRTLLQAYDITLQATPQNTFSDLPDNHPYAKDLITAHALGILSGDAGKNTVRPDAPINRAELAKLLVEVSGKFAPKVQTATQPKSSAAAPPAQSSSSVGSAVAKPVTGDVRTVATPTLNVRNDSRINATILWIAEKGMTVQVLEVLYDDWARVRFMDGREGYVWVHHLGK